MQQPPPAPRSMPMAALSFGAKFLLLFGSIWMLVGLSTSVIFLFIGHPFWVDWRLDDEAEVAEGTPLSVTTGSARSDSETSTNIEVRFIDNEGTKHVTKLSTFDPEVISHALKKQPLKIEYDPSEPSVARVKGGSASLFGYLALIPVPFALVGMLVFAIGLHLALRQRAIYRSGKPVLATVSEVRTTGGRQNRRRVMRARYGFEIAGQTYEGDKTTVDPPSVGQDLWVFYDPSDPQKNVAA